MSLISIDPQISGVYDDGTEAGALRAKLVSGELVPVPFRLQGYAAEAIGATASFQDSGIADNPDGSHTAINVNVPADPTRAGVGARIRFPFYGRKFGLRFKREATGTADMSVSIDGVPYQVTGPLGLLGEDGATIVDTQTAVLVADDLSDGLHYADIVVVADTAATRLVLIYGYLAERRAGYSEGPHLLGPVATTVTLTTSAAVISKGSGFIALRSIQKIIYANITASPVTVTVERAGVTIWSKSVPANDTIDLDFGGPMTTTVAWMHKASAGSAINATVIGSH